MKIEWSSPARGAFNAYIDYLTETAPHIVQQASHEVMAATERVGRRPHVGRPSRWPGLREWSLLRWKKILVYSVREDRIVIVALYDARQNLSRLAPKE